MGQQITTLKKRGVGGGVVCVKNIKPENLQGKVENGKELRR